MPTRNASKTAPKTTAAKPETNEDLYHLIAETAYFKAKARGFQPGGEIQDWTEAEAEVRRRVRGHSATQ